ncbi:type VII secretion-associated serine protease [Catellatospora sp. TT07R-123]|uniref:S8 family serine peptidase n=1 Tax=Catellatospora sp. TT07R-123 TaxID=2733863 RepID=UPI001B09C2B3|nr:S8 family serine peptidase [Catellatospora sp. TT07R-123]GHJ48464.1 type VII secretion-associated serine protease [Catellatospora sp. TT07R-123]
MAAGAIDKLSDGQWFHQFLRTTEAHRASSGAGTVVAVLDTGVAHHPDLDSAVLSGVDITGTGSPDGRTDVIGHGTAMAGIIAANGKVHGVAPAAKILTVRVQETAGGVLTGRGSLEAGIRWAIEQRADVISISLGGKYDLTVHNALIAAMKADIVVVAAAGNRPDSTTVDYPASQPGVVAVAGVDRHGNHSAVSVAGPEVVISAPSEGISSTSTNNDWSLGSGTSDAAAIVAGAVALIRSKYPDMPAAEVIHRLTATATDKGPKGRDDQYGYGVLNLVAALTANVPPLTPVAAPSTPPSAPPSTNAEAPADDPLNLGILLAGLAGLLVLVALVVGAVILAGRRGR